MKYAILILLLYSSAASADSYIYLGSWSYHHSGAANSEHNLVAGHHDKWFLGGYKNSSGEATAVALMQIYRSQVGDFEFSFSVGATYGYRGCDFRPHSLENKRTLCPSLMPAVSYTRYRVQPTVNLIADGAALSFRIRL